MTATFLRSLLLVPLAGVIVAARAQDATADDWDFTADPARQLTVAAVQYSSGAILQVQCQAGQISLGISGLAPSSLPDPKLVLTRNDGRVQDTYWHTTADRTGMVMDGPVRDIRSLKAGGTLVLDSPPGNDPPLHIRLDLPSQATSVDRVLTACDRSLADPRDDIPEAGEVLLESPRVEAADPAFRRGGMQIELSCLIAGGRLAACQSDHETPRDSEVGAATAARADGTRLRLRDPLAAEGRRIDIVITTSRIRRRP